MNLNAPGLDDYRNWSPAAQQTALTLLEGAQNDKWRPFYCKRRGCDGKPHGQWEWNHARADQRPPRDLDWLVWLLKSGRGAGKTRAAAEYTQRMTEAVPRLAIVAATGADVRDTCLEGQSGIVSIAPPDNRPHYEPSKRRLTWPNGCVGTTFTAEEPDRLRGPEHGFAWVDEPAHWPLVQETWDNLLFGLRLGKRPRIVASTTPKPRPWVKEITKDPRTRVSTSSTYANIDNLAPVFAERIIARYEGTRLGRQEIHGELLEDVEGALWNYDMIEPYRVQLMAPTLEDLIIPAAHIRLGELKRIVVGVDPAGGAKKANDETGIVVVGVDHRGHLYVLADYSGRYSPLGWAQRVDAAYDDFQCDAVVAETNYGGEMVSSNLRSAGVTKRVVTVHSRRGKAIRAEPIVGIYEQEKAHHAGVFTELEEEMTSWLPYEDRDSPNRLDALVHGATNLVSKPGVSDFASPTQLASTGQRMQQRSTAARQHHLHVPGRRATPWP